MKIRSHGYDSITLSFANSQYPTIPNRFNPAYLSFIHDLILKKATYYKDTEMKDGYGIMQEGWIDNVKFWSTSYFTTLSFSLPRFFNGHNATGLDIRELTPSRVKLLSETLGFDVGLGKISRLDYCFDFCSMYPWEAYKNYIKRTDKKFKSRLVNETSLYIGNKSREILFYPQDQGRYEKGSEGAKAISDISNSDRRLPNLFRVELRLFKPTLKKIKIDGRDYANLLLNDIISKKNNKNYNKPNRNKLFEQYKKLLTKFKCDINHKSDKNNIFPIPIPTNLRSSEVQSLLLAYLISMKGIDTTHALFPESQFASPHLFNSFTASIDKANKLLENANAEGLFLDDPVSIKKLIKEELQSLCPKRVVLF